MNLKNSETLSSITELIPHREPMIMIDRVLAMDKLRTKTSFYIREEGLFVSNGYMSEMGILENIAQTSFVFLNYYFADAAHQMWSEDKETLGFISTILDTEVFRIPKVGETLETITDTELSFTSDTLKICNIEAVVYTAGQQVMTARMKMLLQTKDK